MFALLFERWCKRPVIFQRCRDAVPPLLRLLFRRNYESFGNGALTRLSLKPCGVHSIRRLSTKGPIESAIISKLNSRFAPTSLAVVNESNMHNVPQGSESHFKVKIVSKCFENLSRLQRHRLVNNALEAELREGLHALSIIAETPAQAADTGQIVPKSPPCKGGSQL